MKRVSWMLPVVAGAVVLAYGLVVADVAMPRDKWSPIRLVSEDVNIVLGASKVTVEATFNLKNEKDAVKAVIGYPRGMLEESLNDFTVTVDGKPVEVTSQEGRKGDRPRMGVVPGRKKDGPLKSAYQFAGAYPEWKTFEVSFATKGKRKVVVKYHVKPAEVETEENGKLLTYVYTMQTGATWLGNIDKASIRAKLDGLSEADIVTTTPRMDVRKASAAGAPLVWTFEDFKPTQDIEITFRPPTAQAKK